MQTVNITVKSDDPIPVNVQGVTIYIYTTSSSFVTSGTTNSSGIITISLPENDYDLLFYKQGFSTVQPQRIQVVSNLANNFTVTGHVRSMPESINTNLCRVSGFLYDLNGLPLKEVYARFNPVHKNIIVNNIEIFNSPIEFGSNNKGYYEFDLYKGLKLEGFINGYYEKLMCKIPSTNSVDIFKLLFPLPILLTHPNTISRNLSDGSICYSYSLLYNDNNYWPFRNDWAHIEYDNSNPSVASVFFTDTQVCIQPTAVGSTTISFTRIIDENYVWINPDPFTANNLVITVS